jgi:hypothetical protein
MSNSARLVAVLLIAGVAACERSKSANPLSPTIAGPLPNITMYPPEPVQPQHGKVVLDTEQPLVLVMNNPDSNSPRPFTSEVQIAVDDQFANVVVSRTGIAPGGDGMTRLSLGDRLAPGRRYYWRGLAADGANNSGWSRTSMFEVVIPVVLGAPEPVAPGPNARVTTVTPELRVRNGFASGPHGPLVYEFQISPSPNFTSFIADHEVPRGSGETKFTAPPLPSPDTPYYWRVRQYDDKNLGPWSTILAFVSPAAAPAPGPGPGGPPQPPGSCASNSGPAIIACIAAKYPERLAAGVSHSQRVANMEFLRDRMIEAGKCGGLDLGWNLKRGGPDRSIDFLARNDGGGNVMGIDIGIDYDNTSAPLRLAWSEAGYGATFDPYPSVPCQGN